MNEATAALVLVAALASPFLLDRYPAPLARPAVATAGTVAVAYGGREVLRALGGGYYCCSHAYYATAGVLLAFAGWVALLAALGVAPSPFPAIGRRPGGTPDGDAGGSEADGPADAKRRP